MKVTRIAWTEIDRTAMYEATDHRFATYGHTRNEADADVLAEFAGRACYQSWGRKNPETRLNKDYLRSTVAEKAHESITAHASATYYITGISRSLTHELIRHRWLAFSELSQRYVDMEDADIAIPPALRGDRYASTILLDVWAKTTYEYVELAAVLEEKGLSRKKAREAARAVLPSMAETRIVVTGNLRAWRDFIKQRWNVQADAEIRELAGEILFDLKKVAPNTFQDIPSVPFGTD